MPKRRPRDFLNRLGRRIRARRLHLGRTGLLVAKGAEISTSQYWLYENGQGHPPAATLHRIAHVLGTTTSALLGETMAESSNEQFDVLIRLYADPFIGQVTRYMQDMTVDERQTVQTIAGAILSRKRPVETVKVMQ
jgi:transcriptional regulator with XRE-family HTH domain